MKWQNRVVALWKSEIISLNCIQLSHPRKMVGMVRTDKVGCEHLKIMDANISAVSGDIQVSPEVSLVLHSTGSSLHHPALRMTVLSILNSSFFLLWLFRVNVLNSFVKEWNCSWILGGGEPALLQCNNEIFSYICNLRKCCSLSSDRW